MGDPSCYISPDGKARFDTIQLAETGRNRVRVWGVQGLPAPETLKVSLTIADGWKATHASLVGDDAACPPTLRGAPRNYFLSAAPDFLSVTSNGLPATPNSSTSNSSVASGGITSPAPRLA
jgi:hypothetical protein